MALPYFYQEEIDISQQLFQLDEATSKHCVQVLRMETGEELLLTNGKGLLVKASIVSPHKKHCQVAIVTTEQIPAPQPVKTMAVSLLKNASRFEWFLEKATELGINAIQPIICKRTERQHFKESRNISILIAAMLQSQKAWLPDFSAPIAFEKAISIKADQLFIAHCIEDTKKSLKQAILPSKSQLLLIGPEGDFTEEEVALALNSGFEAVSLGKHRLRTETAAVYGAVVLAEDN